MNKKMLILVSVIIGLVCIPLVAAAPSFTQQQNGDTLQTQERLQTKDCCTTCEQDAIGEQICLPVRERTQDQQRLQTRDCNFTCNCDENCLTIETQTKQCNCQQQCANTESIGRQHSYGYQNQFQQRNQAP